jgi:hypothetical protein
MENAPQDVGTVVTWKDGLVSSTIGKKEKAGKKLFKEKARERSINVGMNHGMALLGELHANEYNSRMSSRESIQASDPERHP